MNDCSVSKVTHENKPNKKGVVRAIARSDHNPVDIALVIHTKPR
jgi:hypothetical protein